MKKAVLLSVIASVVCLFSATVSSAQGKWGPDSAECIKYLSYYKEYYKQRNYDDALPNWRKAFTLCPPTANQTMLIDGTSLMRRLITANSKDPVYFEALVDTLMTLHDLRVANFPKYAVTALNNKGQDLVSYVKNDPERLYSEFDFIINTNKTQVRPSLLVIQMNTICQLYQNGTLSPEDVLLKYNEMMEILDGIVPASDIEKGNIEKIRTDMENLFISSNVASCENLIALYTPRFEANHDDLQLATNIVRMLSTTEGCMDNDLFTNAATRMHELEPSYTSAHFLYQVYSQQGNLDTAVKYMEEAIAYAESDNATDAQYYYELAAYCFKNGQNAKSFGYAQKAAQLDSSLEGKAYMLIGTIWGSQVCPGNDIERRSTYWVAVDYLVKAKNADPSLAEDADRMIAQYRTFYPQAAEAFMYNVTNGDSYTVSCGGMRAVTTVKTQQ